LSGLSNQSTYYRHAGPAGSVTSANSHAIAARAIRARRFRLGVYYRSDRSEHDPTCIHRTRSDDCFATLNAPLSPYCNDRKGCAFLRWVYYCLFGLLSVSGLRLLEARNLKLEDVDLKTGVLTIRNAKFGRDRLVPIHASTCKVLATYIARRQRHWAGRAVSSYLFVSSWGNRLDGAQIHRAFYAVSRRIGLRGATDSHGPRLHDFRHRVATTTLVNWYRSNEDPARRLPLLSAFLGHVHVADTQWYLSASPELMREAMRRLEHRWEKRP
jgi:integrase/recombinase XerD